MKKKLRSDLLIISEFINRKEKILDVGCGDGSLLKYLSQEKDVKCRGIELSLSGVNECLKKGLSVVQGDANFDLDDYPKDSFSTVILSQTLQAMIYPDKVIENLIRIADRAIISFPNFGYWKIRRDFLFSGLMPKNSVLKYEWFNTPNIHLCTISDFENFCIDNKIFISKFLCLNENGESIKKPLSNLRGYQAIFCVSKKRI